jgi:Polyketide cyclase / dehydrase and lipid transport
MTTWPRLMLTVERVITAPPEAVWDVLTDVQTWPEWSPTISRAEVDGSDSRIRYESTGRVYTPVGVAVPFVISEFAAGRHWAWTVAGVPATRHRVDAVPDGARVSFEVPWWASAYLPVCSVSLRRLQQLAGR